VVTAAIVGDGTTEARWLPWLASRSWPRLDLTEVSGRRVVVLAAHPDDEILGVGGLMVRLATLGHSIGIVWATDGEASHPDSSAISRTELGTLRRDESRRALDDLRLRPAFVHHLGLPDGGVAGARDILRTELRRIVAPGDLVIAPWSFDGHPDHDALGEEATSIGSLTWHYPIWMWHWATPDDERVPWERCRLSAVPNRRTKKAAISRFKSQVQPVGPADVDAAILPPHVVARFLRRHELVIT
jgi:LmbE family N-acetylglucosaminyl deacetylase